MAVEDKNISNKTAVQNINGQLTITTSYFKEENVEIVGFISSNQQNVNGVSFNEGDLGFNIEGTLDYFSLVGEDLIAVSDDPSKYSIDSDGNLILTT